jgi:Protein of unknown function (DUF721).
MKRTESKSIGRILDDFFQDNPVLREKLAETKLINSWEKVLGSGIDRYTESMYIKKRSLYVRLSSSVLKSELMMSREKLVSILNTEAGMSVIDTIVFI